jgi:hypothetical protein
MLEEAYVWPIYVAYLRPIVSPILAIVADASQKIADVQVKAITFVGQRS